MKPLTLNRHSVNLIATGLVAAIVGCASDENDGGGAYDINASAVGGAFASTDRDGASAGRGGAPTLPATKALSGKGSVGGGVALGSKGGSAPRENTSRGGSSSGTNLGGNASVGGTTGSSTGGNSNGGNTTGGTGPSTRVDCGTVATDFSCVTDRDCCLVSNACQSVLYLTNGSQKAAVQSCLDGLASSPCPACLAAPVQLSCVSRRCVGTVLDRAVTGYSSAFSSPHCGALPLPVGVGGASARVATTVAGAQLALVPVAAGGNVGAPLIPIGATKFTCSSM